MEITEVRIKLADPHYSKDGKLLAYATVTLDDVLVIRDLKLIAGVRGPFVSMPSRKVTDPCPFCRCINHVRSAFCNKCGCQLDPHRGDNADFHADICFPVCSSFRDKLTDRVVMEYHNAVRFKEAVDVGNISLPVVQDTSGERGQEAAAR